MTHLNLKLAAVYAVLSISAVAEPVEQYLYWTDKSTIECRNADGDVVTWTNGNNAVWKAVQSGNSTRATPMSLS